MGDLRFGVYSHRFVYDGDRLLQRDLIVLKDNDGDIVGWTNFHIYARSGKKALSRSLYGGGDKRCMSIVKLLNYVFFESYHVTRLVDITEEMVRDFLTDYGLCRLKGDTEETHRGEAAVNRCVSHVIDFLDLMTKDNPSCRLNVDKLFATERVFSKRKKRYVEKRVPTFEVNYRPSKKKIFRDLPEGAFQIIMNEIQENCSAFAGLRPSESCNVRREDSPIGPGLLFEMQDGEVTNIYIDLTEEKVLRSDYHVSVGRIKKEQKRKVYHAFIGIFIECYNDYMKYIEGRPYEKEYGALTNNSKGRAYTYDSYYKEFNKVVQASIPKMLASGDPHTVTYGHLLMEHNITPHVLRHWFSVKLTLAGETAASLMHWRGDKSIESSLEYLQDKSELERQYKEVSDEVFNYSLWKAGKIMREEHGRLD